MDNHSYWPVPNNRRGVEGGGGSTDNRNINKQGCRGVQIKGWVGVSKICSQSEVATRYH